MDDHPSPPPADEARPHLRPPGPPMSLKRRIVWIALLLIVVAGLGFWIKNRPATRPAGFRFARQGPVPVVAAPVTKGDIGVVLNALGTVTPIAMVTVRTQISGQLTHLYFHEGEEVAKGAPLAEIDPRPYEAQIAQAEGQLTRDQALLGEARTDLQRYRILKRQDSIARQRVEDQTFLVRQYEGTVAADQAQVRAAKVNLAYCHIVSPIAGRVGLRQVDAGNYVTPSDTNGIVVVTQMHPISVLFSLPQGDLPEVLRRIRAGAKLTVGTYDSAGKEKLATGTLSAINNQIDTSTGTVQFRADFANPSETLYPNQFVNIRLLVETLKGVTLMPTTAVQHGEPGTYVYLVRPNGTVAAQAVTLGPSENGTVAVTAGLKPGERVVVDGADKLHEGAHVRLEGAGARSGPRPTAARGHQPRPRP